MIAGKAILGLTYLNHSKPGGGGSGQAYRYLTGNLVLCLDFSRVNIHSFLERVVSALGAGGGGVSGE